MIQKKDICLVPESVHMAKIPAEKKENPHTGLEQGGTLLSIK